MFRRLDDLNSQEEKLLLILISLLFVLVFSMGYISFSKRDVTLYMDNTAVIPSYDITMPLIPSEGVRTIRLQEDRITGISMQNVFINKYAKFADGRSAGNIRVENRLGNAYAIKVDVIRLDNNQNIMSTGLIDPGYFVEYRELDKPLPKGNYVCIANFTMYNMETFEIIGQASTQIVVMIEA